MRSRWMTKTTTLATDAVVLYLMNESEQAESECRITAPRIVLSPPRTTTRKVSTRYFDIPVLALVEPINVSATPVASRP